LSSLISFLLSIILNMSFIPETVCPDMLPPVCQQNFMEPMTTYFPWYPNE
jgi:hypothetical protein